MVVDDSDEVEALLAKTVPVLSSNGVTVGVGKSAVDVSGKLSMSVHMAIGMKAMVLLNVATEADIANGTRGVIQDIILDEREEMSVADEEGIIQLKYPPAMLLFKPDRISRLSFPGLPAGIIPLTPSQIKFTVTGRSGKKYKVKRRQYAMTAGYAFTDYKSQGQTIEYVIIDIGRPPTGSLAKQGKGHH